ncbi:hypothetical protein [Marinimicrobium sp. ARAG 43.8]|uniref:hypothetical protein n=1 Tax=Marinimicrobium sp. ARAG 43.8 TaxID=3418719 RepID=UPI003CE6EB0A
MMMTWNRMNPLAIGLSAFLALGLTACGGSSTNIVEREPVEDPGHDHSHGEVPETKGRLVVNAFGEGELVVYSLDDGEELNHFELAAPASALYPSPGDRFAVAIQRNEDQVNAVDAGLIRESHGDHWDYSTTSPAFMDFTAPGSRPTHYTLGDGRAVIFYDGNSGSGELARVGVFTEADLADNGAGRWLDLDSQHHGAAQHFDGSLFVTRKTDDSASLPDQVAQYHWHESVYEEEVVFDTLCPSLHGSAQWDEGVAFGCADGVLLIHAHGDHFHELKLDNPAGINGRIGSLYAHEASEQMVGVASGELYLVDAHEETITALNWQGDATRSAIAYAFDGEGEHFLILDDDGGLTRLEVADGWAPLERVSVVTSDLVGLDEGLNLAMAVSKAGPLVYVTDPVANTVMEVNLESGEVSEALALDVTPAGIVWAGFEDALVDHDHDEEHDHAH